jgi:hypothetical protein
MGALSESEARLSQALTSAVAAPAPEKVDLVTTAATEVLRSARTSLEWLNEHPAPNAGVNVATREAWTAYEAAAITLIEMATGAGSMTPENGEIARAAIARAQSENWEAAMAFVKAVGP